MGNSVTLYYGKVNLNSSHIFEVYDEKLNITDVLKKLYSSIQDNIKHTRIDMVDDIETYRATYIFDDIEKDIDTMSIYGKVIKKSNLYANQRDEQNRPIKVAVPNEECIQFYFDVMKEAMVFYTTQRFGYNDFIYAMQMLLSESINKMYGSDEEYYNFDVSLKRSNLSMDTLKEELKEIKNIESLRIDIIPPNPDDEILEEIKRNGEKKLDDLKEGNVTYKSTFLQSKSSTGIVLDSSIVEEEIDSAIHMHSKISDDKTLDNGYVQVEATSKDGYTYSTKDRQPIKSTIEKECLDDKELFKKSSRHSIKIVFE